MRLISSTFKAALSNANYNVYKQASIPVDTCSFSTQQAMINLNNKYTIENLLGISTMSSSNQLGNYTQTQQTGLCGSSPTDFLLCRQVELSIKPKASILVTEAFAASSVSTLSSIVTYQVTDLVSKLQYFPSQPNARTIQAGLLKVRYLNLKNTLPIGAIDSIVLGNIINSVWQAQLSNVINSLIAGSMLANQQFKSQIESVKRYLTSQSELVYRIDYTVSLANKDPESLGISDPTYKQFQNGFNQQNSPMSYCACESYSYGRIYVNLPTKYGQDMETRIPTMVASVWDKLNPNYKQLGNRVRGNFTLNDGFTDANGAPIARLSYQWQVDGADPNPVFFNVPMSADITTSLLSAGLSSYTSEPYMLYSFYLTNFAGSVNKRSSESSSSLLNKVINQAWSTANKNFQFKLSNINYEQLASPDANG
jgi:hypothetical protein